MGSFLKPKEYIDSLGMWDALYDLPDQLDKAISYELDLDLTHESVQDLTIVGMGGSALAGDIAQELGASLAPIPIICSKSYELPGYVGPDSLVIAVSFSGNTEETLEAFSQAVEAGAHVVAISTGGDLESLALQANKVHMKLPDGIPQPRAAVGVLVGYMLRVLDAIEIIPGAIPWLRDSISELEKARPGLFEQAHSIANKIRDTVILAYGSKGIGKIGALRLKNQINENLKSLAFYNEYPELCHNELAGWGQLGDLTRQVFSLVQFSAPSDHPQIYSRMRWVKELLQESLYEIIEVKATLSNDLAQMFEFIMLADALSLHLAGMKGIDPGPIPVLVELKDYLRSKRD